MCSYTTARHTGSALTKRISNGVTLTIVVFMCAVNLLHQMRGFCNNFDGNDMQYPNWYSSTALASATLGEQQVRVVLDDNDNNENENNDKGVFLTLDEQIHAQEFCSFNWDSQKDALDLIQVEPNPPPLPPKSPSILCYVHTISSFQEKSQAVRDTWGPRCDKLIFISNETSVDTVHLSLFAYDHAHLWDKTRKSLQYLVENYPDYDYYYKADDDTYIVMENLRAYLLTQSLDEPLILGHRLMLPDTLAIEFVSKDEYLIFLRRFGPWIYPSGGSGYVMNNLLLKNMVQHLNQSHCSFSNNATTSDRGSATIPEDVAAAFCARYAGGYLPDTRDRMHKNRWHPLSPFMTLHAKSLFKKTDWWHTYHAGTGGVQSGELAVSQQTIALHYGTPDLMRYIDAQLYACRNYHHKAVPEWFRALVHDQKWKQVYGPVPVR